MTRSKTILAGIGAALLLGTAAQAADLGPIYTQAPELTPVEIGSGWYLRGDVAYDFETDLDFTQRFFTPLGSSSDGYDEARLQDGASFSAGVGYQLTDWLRTDATFRYFKQDIEATNGYSAFCDFSPACGSRDQAEVTGYELMANAYVDLGTIAGFTPYVGGGVGAVQLNYDDVSAAGYCAAGIDCGAAGFATASYEGEDSWRFAYALTAGVSYDLSSELSLDVGYRYLKVEGGDAYSFDSSATPGTGITGEDDGFDRHTIQAGLRYKIW